jgi:hypothetical protein
MPRGSISAIPGAPVRTDEARDAKELRTSGEPIIRGKARIDIGCSLRSSSDAAVAVRPSLPGEDALGGEQPEHPVQRVGVAPAPRRQHVDAGRLRADRVRHPELRDHLQAPRRHGPGRQAPHHLVRLQLDHARLLAPREEAPPGLLLMTVTVK